MQDEPRNISFSVPLMWAAWITLVLLAVVHRDPVAVQLGDAIGRPPLDAVHRIAEAEQIFGEIGAVLTGDTGNERNAPFRILNRHVHSNKAPGLPKSSSTPTNHDTLRWTGP